MQERSAGIVLARKDGDFKYLLLHYDSGHWDFAKGHVESGESEESAALRELEEETGIKTVDILEGFKDKIYYTFKRGRMLVSKSVVFFVGITEEKNISLSREHKGFEWLPFDEAIERLTFNNAKEVLQKANAFLIK